MIARRATGDSMSLVEKLTLGTVQFGLPYGVDGVSRPPQNEVMEILDYGLKSGIHMLDTASVYGESETILGSYPSLSEYKVITKIPPVASDPRQVVSKTFNDSLQKLKLQRVEGLMVHHAPDLLENSEKSDGIWNSLSDLKNRGLVKRLGVSVYEPDQVFSLLNLFPEIDFFQLPFNLLDQRFKESGVFEKLNELGKGIHVRSVFLQGILLMDEEQLIGRMSSSLTYIKKVKDLSKNLDLTPLQLCMGFALSHNEIEKVVVGVKSLDQWNEIVNSVGHFSVSGEEFSSLSCSDPKIIDPRLWN